jgi:DNA-binding PadR family transcriptional regulator
MAQQRKVGNLLALAVLAYLTRGPMHPYELSRTLREHGDERSIKFNQGTLYTVVRQLAAAGFIAERETTREGHRPERTVYALTQAGRAEFDSWLRELVEKPEYEYPHFVAALSLLAALPPDEAADLLTRRLSRLREQRAETSELMDAALAGGLHPLFLIEEEYRLAMADAEISFVEHLIERITHPTSGWAPLWASFHNQQPRSRKETPHD